MAANPNTLTADFNYFWSRRQQVKRAKLSVYKDIVSFEEKELMQKGERVYRPYRSALVINTLGGDGSYSRQALTDTEEHLDIDQEKEVSFYVKRPDEVQSNYRIAANYSDDATKRFDEWIDGLVQGEYDHASSIVANYEVAAAGSASDGIGFTLTTSNILTVFGKINRKLDRKHIPARDRWGIISPEFRDTLWQFIAGKESALGDKVGTNPNEIGSYAGFRLFVSENSGWSARLEIGTVAADNDTVTINGLALRFKTTLAAAGDLLRGATPATSCDALVGFINNSESLAASTAGTLYYNVTDANRALVKEMVATDGATYVTIIGKGYGYVAVSEVITDVADIWTTTKQLQHNLFGQGKPIDLVIQKYPTFETKDRSGYIGKDFVTWLLGGIKTFAEGADALVDVQIRSDAF